MDVLQAILALWRAVPDLGHNNEHYHRNESLPPGEIVVRLLRTFPRDQIVREISRFLEEMSALMETFKAPDRRSMFLCDCCLLLISDQDGLRVPAAVVKQVIRSFPISIWYRRLTRVVPVYLSRADLLETLADGLSDPRPATLESCLEGIRMYAKFARREDNPERLESAERRIAPLIDRYRSDERAHIARSAERSKQALAAIPHDPA
jgi:hypothetical protein